MASMVDLSHSYNLCDQFYLMSKKDIKKETQKITNNDKISNSDSKKSIKPPPETQEARRTREQTEQQIAENLNRENIHIYLKNIEPNKHSDHLAQQVVQNSLQQIQQHLQKGIIDIPESPSQLPQQPKTAPKMTYEELREQQNRMKREQMQKKIDYLYDQIRGQSGKSKEKLHVELKEILSKEEHEQKIQHILAEKAERKRRMEELNQEQQRRKKEEEQREEELRKLQKEKRKEEKRNAIENTLKKRKEEHQKLLSLQKQLQKQYESAKSKERLHLKMEERYHSQVLLPTLQEKKNKLKHLREFHKNYDLQAIREHEKKYSLKLQEYQNQLSSRTKQKSHEYQPPPRSDRLSRFLQQQALALREKLSMRKNRNEQMQRRIYSFEKQVKTKYQPKIDETKKQEIIQRYLDESRKHEKLNLDPKKIGEEYLEIAKRMRKSDRYKQEVKTEEKIEEESKTAQHSLQLSRAAHRSDEFYQNMRRKKMENIVNSDQHSAMDKYHFLKLESDKLGEKIKQRQQLARVSGNEQAQQQAAQLLLSSIKAKMGLMNVLKQQKIAQSAQPEQ